MLAFYELFWFGLVVVATGPVSDPAGPIAITDRLARRRLVPASPLLLTRTVQKSSAEAAWNSTVAG